MGDPVGLYLNLSSRHVDINVTPGNHVMYHFAQIKPNTGYKNEPATQPWARAPALATQPLSREKNGKS